MNGKITAGFNEAWSTTGEKKKKINTKMLLGAYTVRYLFWSQSSTINYSLWKAKL